MTGIDLADYHRRASWFLNSRGYRRCDIPACNCPYWHGGHAKERLNEAHEILTKAGLKPHEQTMLKSLARLVTQRDDLRKALDYLLQQTVDQDLKCGVMLTEGEEDARAKALDAIAQAEGIAV